MKREPCDRAGADSPESPAVTLVTVSDVERLLGEAPKPGHQMHPVLMRCHDCAVVLALPNSIGFGSVADASGWRWFGSFFWHCPAHEVCEAPGDQPGTDNPPSRSEE